jgi:hypothetical protein
VTSVAGVASEVGAVSVYALVLLGSGWWAVGTLLAVCAVPMLGLAALTARWLPDRVDRHARGTHA